jgi:hypothetical protein
MLPAISLEPFGLKRPSPHFCAGTALYRVM